MSEKQGFANERTPLVRSVIVFAPQQERLALHRACTAFLVTSAAFFFLFFFSAINLLGGTRHHVGAIIHYYAPWSGSYPSQASHPPGLSFKALEDIIQTTPDEDQVREWSKYYTSGPHLAGKNLSQAEWTRDRWRDFGVVDSHVVPYEVYINYPKDHRLALLESDSNNKTSVKFEATLEEDVLEQDRTSGLNDRVPTFHGYSAPGNVTAQFVFVNYGTYQDYEDLLELGIDLEGKIAIAKYGGNFRGLKVKRAQELGMLGIVIYSDPGDDGSVREELGVKPYPEGPARNPSSVQRGSVQYISMLPGDPTTPGYPSKPGVPRQPANFSTPSIPSLPISYAEALPILTSLNGHGPNATDLPASWQTGGLGYKGVQYSIGPSPANLTLNLYNDVEYTITPLWNVIGIINGTISDEVIVLGNHRDAWIAGGAGDPNSGSSAFNEVIRSFGIALDAGWKPLRTIVMASWDGEEYGLIGSTEWVEEYAPWLSDCAVAYLNVDVGTSGPNFHASAAPLLDDVLREVTKSVKSPNQTVEGSTVFDQWGGKISSLGSGSDYTAFLDHLGITSTDFGFQSSTEAPVYHYHSNYDSFDWMEKFGDPHWQYHTTIAKVWGLLAAILVESPVLQFNASHYAQLFDYYIGSTKKRLSESKLANETISFYELDRSIGQFQKAAKNLDERAAYLEHKLEKLDHATWFKNWRRAILFQQIRDVNKKYQRIERAFLYEPGLDGRDWFKHVVFAPGIWTGYAGVDLPGLAESIAAAQVENFKKWLHIVQGTVMAAWLSILD